MKKLIPFLPLIVFILVTGCSSDSAGEERVPRTSFASGETFVIYNKSDHEVVIEYEGGRRSVESVPCSTYYKRQDPFFYLDDCTIDMGHPSGDLAWNYVSTNVILTTTTKK